MEHNVAYVCNISAYVGDISAPTLFRNIFVRCKIWTVFLPEHFSEPATGTLVPDLRLYQCISCVYNIWTSNSPKNQLEWAGVGWARRAATIMKIATDNARQQNGKFPFAKWRSRIYLGPLGPQVMKRSGYGLGEFNVHML